MKALLTLLTLTIGAATPHVQAQIRAFGGPPDEDRASTRVLYYDSTSQKFAGQVALDYGRPLWDSTYDDRAKFDNLTREKTLRLGKDFWTTLDTTVTLNFKGLMVQPGLHYLGLTRSSTGEWGLALFNPIRIRGIHGDASSTPTFEPDRVIPLEQSETGIRKERLTISLSYSGDSPTAVRLKIEWGPYQLTAPFEAQVPKSN